MRKPFFFLLSLFISCLPELLIAQEYTTETGHAEFHSEVPLHSFTGVSDDLVGFINLADSTVDFYIDLETLETGIGKRDKDMRETLQTDEYPFAEFFGKLISDFDPNNDSPQPVTVRGEFEMHGVSKVVEIDGTLQNTSEGLKVNASWTLNIEDYDIEPPGILFYRVDENQDIEVEATLTATDDAD